MITVAVLYCLPDARCVYRSMPSVEVWDEARDARRFPGGMPVVAHPPCGPWGRMRLFCKGGDGLRELAPLAVKQVRACGGVLEHPACSSLWAAVGLPKPGEFPDQWGGYTLEVDQYNWGHPARKRTWLYIVGVRADALPQIPDKRGGGSNADASDDGTEGARPPRPEIAAQRDAAGVCRVAGRDRKKEYEMKEFDGAKMKAARNVKSIPAYKLAVDLGVHPNTVLNWEAGRGKPDVDQGERLAQVLGVDLDELKSEQA